MTALDGMLRPLIDRISEVQAQQRGAPHFEWGVVTSKTPLQVRLDGDQEALAGTPSTLVAGLSVGERVHVVIQARRATVIGRGLGGGDTDWLPLVYASGYTAGGATQLRYRLKGNVLYIRGGASGTFAAGTYQQITAQPLPSALLARMAFDGSSDRYRGGAMGAQMRPCGWELFNTGHIMLGSNGLSSQPAWIQMNAAIPLD